ncbi:MAG: hypothetical protein AMJ65_08680 [Phycisphaerae bacterium SG8_4]|nr:MAG: hypothetical protein AMJ65_08680 [Phycisphaerae bacterium SG8_4]
MSEFRRYDYLLSVLPALEPMGSIPPMSKREFLEQVADSNGPVRTVEMLLLSDDLTQYQALLTEEIGPDEADSAILSLDKAENEAVLPDFLLPDESTEEQQGGRSSIDAIWSRYFHHAASVARRARSSFLKAWIGFEVGLRNALVIARSHSLELDPSTYLVAPELADKDLDYSHVVSAWSAAAHPLAALEILDKWRWDWLDERSRWYSSSACEIEVYAAKLALLHHWRRILSDKQKHNKASLT